MIRTLQLRKHSRAGTRATHIQCWPRQPRTNPRRHGALRVALLNATAPRSGRISVFALKRSNHPNMNPTQQQLSRSCAAAKGSSCQWQLQLCAVLLAAAAAPAAAGKEKPYAAVAPKVSGADLSSRADAEPSYTTCTNFSQVMQASDARYPAIIRVSDPGARGHPVYTGFFFYQCLRCFSSKTMVVEPQRNFSGR